MSIIYEANNSCFISHKAFVDNIYKDVDSRSFKLKQELFDINFPYKKIKCNIDKDEISCDDEYKTLKQDIQYVRSRYNDFKINLLKNKIVSIPFDEGRNNKVALNTAEKIYNHSKDHNIENANGSNIGKVTIKQINSTNFLFPENCRFFSKDVKYIDEYLENETFDLILLDPPWWNKYIRRKRKKCNNAYNMMFDDDLKNIPIETLLSESGLLVIWCTNSKQHIEHLINNIFKKWKVKLITKWFWLKVTTTGEPICNFMKPPGKQPFEQIIIASNTSERTIPEKKLVVSVPCALHSNKPPLVELLKPFLPKNPKCLEVFARYLLPGWTSFGNEVILFQNEMLYV